MRGAGAVTFIAWILTENGDARAVIKTGIGGLGVGPNQPD
jgi:hypothetical protein